MDNDSEDTVSNQLPISYPIALFNARPYISGWLTQYRGGAALGWCKGCNCTIDFWEIALINKFWSYFPYFEVKEICLQHQFKILKPPLQYVY